MFSIKGKVSTETESDAGYKQNGSSASSMHRTAYSSPYRKSPENEISTSATLRRAARRISQNEEDTDNAPDSNDQVTLDLKIQSPRSSFSRRQPLPVSSSRRGTVPLDDSDGAGLIGLKNLGNTVGCWQIISHPKKRNAFCRCSVL